MAQLILDFGIWYLQFGIVWVGFLELNYILTERKHHDFILVLDAMIKWPSLLLHMIRSIK